VGYNEITGWWKDTGKPEDLILANELLLKGLEEEKFLRADVQVNGANIAGKVAIGTGTTFGKNVTINGPVMIGENCSLENCTIGPNVTIGSGSTIKNCTITDSIVLGNASLTAPLNMTQSIIGAKAIIESGKEKISRLIVGDFERGPTHIPPSLFQESPQKTNRCKISKRSQRIPDLNHSKPGSRSLEV
jgi:glucose-1-phosphate thymidylyltransferase